jgi:hypothetical protein
MEEFLEFEHTSRLSLTAGRKLLFKKGTVGAVYDRALFLQDWEALEVRDATDGSGEIPLPRGEGGPKGRVRANE